MEVQTQANQLDMYDVMDGQSINTIDRTTQEGKKLSYNAQMNARSLSEVPNGTAINLHDLILRRGTRTDQETGEVTALVEVILVTAEGDAWFSQSTGVRNSAVAILDSFGTPDSWPEHVLQVVVKEQRIGNGRMLKTLEVI